MVQYSQVAKRLAQHLCIFGDPKAGKSTLAAMAAEAGYKLIWISADNGHTILDKLSQAAQERINLIAIKDTKDNPRALHTVTKLTDGGMRHICDMHGDINCVVCTKAKAPFTDINLNDTGPDTIVVIDSGSQVVESAINNVIKKEAKSADAVDGYKLDYGDWATVGAVMSRILSNIQVAPYHVILIAHSAETEMEDGTKKLVPLLGTVPFSRNVGKYFDHIVYCTVRLNKHQIGSRTTFMLNVVTGSRTDAAIEDGKDLDILKFFGPPRSLSQGEIMTTSVQEQSNTEAKPVLEDVVDALGPTSKPVGQPATVNVTTIRELEKAENNEAGATKLSALELLKLMNKKKV